MKNAYENLEKLFKETNLRLDDFSYRRKGKSLDISIKLIDRSEETAPVDFFIKERSDGRMEIVKDGKTHAFGKLQSSVIKQLHEASSTDNPWVHGKTLMRMAGSNSNRIDGLFSRCPYWKQLMTADRKGFYKLKTERLFMSVYVTSSAKQKTSK